jgi:hypothetical protein
MQHSQILTLIVLLLVAVLTNCIPQGKYTVEFTAESRASLNIKYTSVAVVTVKNNSVEHIHLVSEEKHGQDIIEYSAGRSSSVFVEYVNGNSEQKCYYSSKGTGKPPTIQSVNTMLKSLVEFNKNNLLNQTIFDKRVSELFKTDLQVYSGVVDFVEKEPVLVFMDIHNVPKYIVGRFLLITIHSIRFGASPIVQHTINILKKKCVDLDDEMKNGSQPAPARKLAFKAMAKPWFLDRSKCCELPHVKDPVACGQGGFTKLGYNAAQKVCVFLHGAGQDEDNTIVNEWTNYWGNIHEFTPQCSERWFIRRDTRNRGWDSELLQQDYCKLAALHNKQDPENPELVIKDTVIFTHSMGNLIFAAGLHRGLCQMDNSSSWYAINAPFAGSMAAAKVKKICHDNYHEKNPISSSKLFGFIAHHGGYCKLDSPQAPRVYHTLVPDFCSEEYGLCMKDLEGVVKKYATGMMCGTSPNGLTSHYSLLLSALAQIVQFGEENDGMVTKSSCEGYHSEKFDDHYTDLFYRVDANHADGTCRVGDGLFNDNRKPCSYYTDKL